MVFLNFVTFLIVGLLIFVHLVHKEPQPEIVLSYTPDSPTNKIEPPIQNTPPFAPPTAESLVNTNIFHPDRGKVPPVEAEPAVPPVKSDSLELVGTFTFGDKIGAIIKEQQTAIKRPEEPGGAVKKVFYLNEKMGNGCLLKKVESTSVVMEQNGAEFTLVLDFADKGSQERQKSIPAIKATPVVVNTKPVTPTPPVAQAPLPAGVTVTPAAAQTPPAKPGTTPVPVPPPPPSGKGRFIKK